MIPEMTQKSSLYDFLHEVELDLYRQAKEAGCPHCTKGGRTGVLDDAFYGRKPRGGPDDLPDELLVRRSLCCRREGCRRRTLPPSCLYLGSKVYWKLVIWLVLACRQRDKHRMSYRMLAAHLGVSRSTVWRWMELYAAEFLTSDAWQARRGLLGADISPRQVFADIWEVFRMRWGDGSEAVGRMVTFLSAPIDAHLDRKLRAR